MRGLPLRISQRREVKDRRHGDLLGHYQASLRLEAYLCGFLLRCWWVSVAEARRSQGLATQPDNLDDYFNSHRSPDHWAD